MGNKKKRLVIGILWPSFWMACITSGVVFSAIDPTELAKQNGFESLSDLAVYSIGFFFFWGICAWTGFFSIIFSQRTSK